MNSRLLHLLPFLILSICGSNAIGQELNDGILVQYPFNDDFLDYSGNSFNAIGYGVQFVEDRNGNPNSACLFDGMNDYVELPNSDELKPDFPMAFSFWVKYLSEDFDDRAVFNTSFEEDYDAGVYMNASSATGQYQITYADGFPGYITDSHYTYRSNGVIDTSKWVCICINLISENTMEIFVDGEELGGEYLGGGGPLVYSIYPGTIGRHDRQMLLPSDYFHGIIDNFRMWNRPLSEEDVLQLCDEDDTNSIINISSLDYYLFPNPANDYFIVAGESEDPVSIEIFDTAGNRVLTNSSRVVQTNVLNSGAYFVKVRNVSQVQVLRLMVN